MSLTELIVKAQHGKLRLLPDPIRWWNDHLRILGFSVLPLRQNHVECRWMLPAIHGDPAHLLLIAQAVACDEAIGK